MSPGGITAAERLTPEEHAAWAARVRGCLRAAAAEREPSPYLLEAADERTHERTLIDWTAYPRRIADCLTPRHASSLLDWRTGDGDQGRSRFQEEYAEWRLLRSEDGRARRFELTTELPDYWVWLAGRRPQRVLDLVARFAEQQTVDSQQVFGDLDPFADEVADAQREKAFKRMMLGDGRSPYNNGLEAICCMRQPTNTLRALLGLVVAAARPRVIRDEISGAVRAANAAEVIPQLGAAAEIGRNSDPVVVERLGRLTLEGRLVAFDGLPAVYIAGVQVERLATPDGAPVPSEWFSVERLRPEDGDTGDRLLGQRLSFEVPDSTGLCVGDLIDLGTGRRVEAGADLADLVRLVVGLRVSAPGTGPQTVERTRGTAAADASTASGCDEVRQAWQAFAETIDSRPDADGSATT
jgi:hypothetical protein